MDNKTLTQLQKTLQNEAQEIIRKFQVLEILAKYGDAHLVGSATTGLMVREDIDVSCFVQKLDMNEYMACVTDFMKTGKVRRMTLIDEWHFKGKRPVGTKVKELEEPDGLYFSIDKITHKDRFWPYVSIWMVPNTNRESLEHVEWIKSKLDESKRITILRLKHHYLKQGILSNVTSYRIYKAVLDQKIETIDKFEEYLMRTEGLDVATLATNYR